MRTVMFVGGVALMFGAVPVAAQQQEDAKSNPEMIRIFAADQADRKDHPRIDWSVVDPADAARRVRVKALLDKGALTTGEDFEAAAFVFQHGHSAHDFLLAHALAMVALAKGRDKAKWIAAASLDRYLMNIGQPQIFGTQYAKLDTSPTMEPYDRALISDAFRAELGVAGQAVQAERLKGFQEQLKAKTRRP